MQCVERMIEPAEIPTTPEIVSTILKTLVSGLIVKVIGIAFFSDIIFVRDSSSLSTAIPKTQKRFHKRCYKFLKNRRIRVWTNEQNLARFCVFKNKIKKC